MKGALISVEGGEGVGKTTFCHNLQKELASRGHQVCLTREPGDHSLGQGIREVVLESDLDPRSELLLFLADRSLHVREKILPSLQKGEILICDRFIDSTFAYQGEFFSLSFLEPLCSFASHDLLPDCTFYLDLDVERAMNRKKGNAFDRIEKRAREFHLRVRQRFLFLAKNHPRICLLDASHSQEELIQEALFMLQHRNILSCG